MNPEQTMVQEFHKAFDITIKTTPQLPTVKDGDLRVALIQEELRELELAIHTGDLVEIADGLGDLLYVVYGAAVTCGIDLQPVFAEIHRSNMSKVGGHKAANGKWIKPATYSKADVVGVLNRQLVPKESNIS